MMQAMRRVSTAGFRSVRFLAVALLAVLCPLRASAQPVETTTPKSLKTSAKAQASPAVPDPVKIRKLVQKIREVSQLPRLDLLKAAEMLGSRLGPPRDSNEYGTDWPLRPTQLIAEATAGVIVLSKESYLSIVPHPSLGLAFEDLAPLLLDARYMMIVQHGHPPGDSVASVVMGFTHVFRVEVGELLFDVPTTVPLEAQLRGESAISQGFEAANGSSAKRNLVRAVSFSSAVREGWQNAQTLGKRRARSEPPTK
jgi:hypothetical protein